LKKSFLHNMIAFVSGKRPKDKIMSAENATELQLRYQDTFAKVKKVEDYPPYLDIVKQLSSAKTEIFRAAVYYLCRVAENESRYCGRILEILQEYASDTTRSDSENSYLREQISKLKQRNRYLAE